MNACIYFKYYWCIKWHVHSSIEPFVSVFILLYYYWFDIQHLSDYWNPFLCLLI